MFDHFSHSKLACPTTDQVRLAPGFGETLERLRVELGEPIYITSACRSPSRRQTRARPAIAQRSASPCGVACDGACDPHSDTIDDPDIGIQLRSLRPFPAAISRRYRMPKHLPHRLLRNTKLPGCLSLAQAFNMACQPHAQIKLHDIHPPTVHPRKVGRLQVAEFNSARSGTPAASVV